MDLFEFETVMDAAVDAGVATVEPVEPAVAAEPVVPAEPAAPVFDAGQFEERIGAQIDQRNAALLQALTPPPAPQTFEYDPFADDHQQQLDRLVEAKAREIFAPYQQAMEQVQQQQVSQWVDQNLDQAMQTYKAPDGSDGDRDAVLYAAAGFRAVTGDDAKAIVAARDYMASHDADIAAKAVKAYQDSLQGGGNAQRDPAIGGAAIGIEPRASSFDDVLNRWETRQVA